MPIPSLTDVRDAALAVAAIALTAITVDELTGRSARRTPPRAAGAPPLNARHGWLHRVDQFGAPVRPATSSEASASSAAAAIDGGNGIFGRVFDSDAVLLRNDPAFTRAGVSYYRVVPEAGPAGERMQRP